MSHLNLYRFLSFFSFLLLLLILASCGSVDNILTNTSGDSSSDTSQTTNDNDGQASPGFTISKLSGNTTEDGGQATFTVKLDSLPDGDVVIDVASLDSTEGTVSSSVLTFTPANYVANQIVYITGMDDSLGDGDIDYIIQVAINSSTADTTGYASLDPSYVSVTNTDDDTAGFTISSISGNTTEGGDQATFTVKLNSEPTDNVVIDVATSDSFEGTVSSSTLTFTTSNYASSQTVTVTGVDDSTLDGDIVYTIQLTLNSDSIFDTTGYASLDPNDVSVTNTDNDTAGFTISSVTGTPTEDEGTATFTVKLNSEPTANVDIGVSSNDETEGTVSPSSLTFTDQNWASPQTLTITGVDDNLVDHST